MEGFLKCLFSRQGVVMLLVIVLGADHYFMRGDTASLKGLADTLTGIILGWFMGKFAGEQPGNGKVLEPPK